MHVILKLGTFILDTVSHIRWFDENKIVTILLHNYKLDQTFSKKKKHNFSNSFFSNINYIFLSRKATNKLSNR